MSEPLSVTDKVYAQRLYDRLVSRIIKDEQTGCWVWQGPGWYKRKWPGHRYGYTSIWDGKKSLSVAVHRAMWIALHGPLSPKIYICHTCDNPKCCNPFHLFEGDPKANAVDAANKKRHMHSRNTHCVNGHLKDEHAVVRIGRNGRPWRICVTCERYRHTKEYVAKRKAA